MSLTNSYASWLKAGLTKYLKMNDTFPFENFRQGWRYETATERTHSILIAAEHRPLETLPAVLPRLWKKDAAQPDQLNRFRRKDPDVLVLDGLTSRERWLNVDAFQTWRYPELYKAKNGKRGTQRVWKSDIYLSKTLHAALMATRVDARPTGQVILVPPTPTTSPYEVVTKFGNVESQPSYNFGLQDNVTTGVALDDALSPRTTTSTDKNFDTGKGGGIWSSEEKNWDGDDLGSTEQGATWQRPAQSATMHASVEDEDAINRSEIMHVGVYEFAGAVERALMLEVCRAWSNASKADHSMNDRTLAAWMQQEWQSQQWEQPEMHISHVYGHRWLGFTPTTNGSKLLARTVTHRLRSITTDQVCRLREKALKANVRSRDEVRWDLVRAMENILTPVLSRQ